MERASGNQKHQDSSPFETGGRGGQKQQGPQPPQPLAPAWTSCFPVIDEQPAVGEVFTEMDIFSVNSSRQSLKPISPRSPVRIRSKESDPNRCPENDRRWFQPPPGPSPLLSSAGLYSPCPQPADGRGGNPRPCARVAQEAAAAPVTVHCW